MADEILPPLALPMSFRQMEMALDAPVTNAQFRILMLLASYAHDDGTNARPGIDRLVMRSGMSERSVQEALQGLKQAGLIAPIAHEHGGRGRATEYRLTLETPQQSAPIEPRFAAPFYSGKGAKKRKPIRERVQTDGAKGAENRSERVRKTASKGAANRTPISQESVNESVRESGDTPRPPAGPQGDARPTVPEPLVPFDQALREAPGYAPTKEFYAKVLASWGDLDLEVQALGMADWLQLPKQRREKRIASTGFVYNWLQRAAERRPPQRNGYSNSTAPRHGSPLSRTQVTAEQLAQSRARPNSVALTDEIVAADPDLARRRGWSEADIAFIQQQQAAKRTRESSHG